MIVPISDSQGLRIGRAYHVSGRIAHVGSGEREVGTVQEFSARPGQRIPTVGPECHCGRIDRAAALPRSGNGIGADGKRVGAHGLAEKDFNRVGGDAAGLLQSRCHAHPAARVTQGLGPAQHITLRVGDGTHDPDFDIRVRPHLAGGPGQANRRIG